MKKRTWNLLAVSGMLFTFLAETQTAIEDTKTRIIEASQIFSGSPDPAITQEKIVNALHDFRAGFLPKTFVSL